MSGNENILSTVECIFPATVYISNLNRQLNEDELSFLDIQKQNLRLNQYNYSTVNNFILHEKELSLLKKDLELHIDNFFMKN